LKRLVVFIIVLAVLAAIVLVLFNNKAKMAAKMHRPEITSYAVSVLKVSKQKLSENLTLVGTILASNDVMIVSETQGRVTNVLKRVEDYVTAGTVMVQVDDELPQARLTASKNNYEKAQRDLERFEGLYKDQLISNSQLEGAQQTFKLAESDYTIAQRQFNNTRITSPISGVITDLPVNNGVMLNPGTVVANVIDISNLKLKLNVAEQDVFQLKPGDSVMIETDIYPGVKFNGRIESISQKGDDAHTYPVKVSLANSQQHPLKAGMFAQATFQTKNTKFGVIIPRAALVEDDLSSPQVYVVEDGIAKLRNLTLGPEVGTNIVIQQGVNEGESIVIKGQTNLKDGINVNVVE
jgi:RND family efflux transporter MFP subunit